MPNWRLLVSAAIIICSLGLMYYMLKGNMEGPNVASKVIVQPEHKSENPLLTASSAQFDMWFPGYCQAELYFRPTNNEHTKKVCLRGVANRVQESTGTRLTDNQILDPAVVAHWKKIGTYK